MNTLIVGNWKCNPTTSKEAEDIFDAVKKGVRGAKAEVVICPPFVFLPLLKGMTLGAQDVFYQEKGAFTGEISPTMLKNSNVEYVIVGHSERRKLGETDETINKKIKASLDAGLKVIFCVGENEGEDKSVVLEKQIKEGLKEVDVLNVVIAYEPVWAIGTGKNCGIEDTKAAVELIKKIAGENVKVLYGGSVNSQNSGDYLKNGEVDGLLVGGASLKAEEFVKIVESAQV